MVRALACHVRSCGFESRLPRTFFRFALLILILISSLFLSACGSHSSEDFREDGDATMRLLIKELQAIHSYSTLSAAAPKLKRLFNDLVDTMLKAREYHESHPAAEISDLSPKNHASSEQLRTELNRIYRLDGGRELIEKCQEGALLRLDAFEKNLVKRRTAKHQ